ncbi:MAG TPA: PHB depolymerase family esterase [Vicinamibacterales bacterium]|nr:PHB depolymerase family esterase [Vicinamibacterales bacterium]
MIRLAIAAGLGMVVSMPQPAPSPFVPRMFSHNGKLMPYRMFAPEGATPEHPLPLIVWLHGASGVGTDNRAQIAEGGNDIGSRLWVRPDIQAKYPAFVIAPQSPSSEVWGRPASATLTTYGQLVIDLIDQLARAYPIDRDRVYVLGQSRGGIGVWDLISKRPDVFAAAVPLCAQGDPKRVAAARGVKVWVFHGAKDTMPVENAREMVAALTAAGANVKYTEYPDLGHEIWTRAFAEPDLPAWLFAQRRHEEECGGSCLPAR